ncbi:MAG: cation:dicarboxylase symporter family transporter [Bacteroidetes bacterium]|nr:cation:dicarboxylase symporter family transporter [Bacteroidota bacterium]
MQLKTIRKNLTFWVLLAIVLGIVLGHFAPATAVSMQPLGKYFIDIVKLFINPIIVVTIISGICGMDSLKRVGRIGGKAILYFEVITTIALLIGIVVAYIIQPGSGIATNGINPAAISSIQKSGGVSLLAFFRENATIQFLLLSILVGLFLNRSTYKIVALEKIQWMAGYLFKALGWVMRFSPIGAFGGMAFTIGKYGLAALLPLGKLMLCVYVTMFLFIVIVLGAVLRYYQVSVWKFLRYLRDELLIVLGTSSSEAALPSLMNKLEKMGCHRTVVGLVVPAGYSFNLDGTSIYLSMAIIFLAQVFQVDLSWGQIATIFGVLMITSKGAAGVTGSGFIILASTLSAVKVIPVEGLALLLGVDRFMSEARAITNFIGNGVATIFLSINEGLFSRDEMKKEFDAFH